MPCDSDAWSSAGEGEMGGDVGGYRVRRADPGEQEALRGLIEREWTVAWLDAAMLGLSHQPVGVFVAEKGDELVGFAAYEVDQCLGRFGPTGVARGHRGHGLGARVVLACLDHLQKKRRKGERIGWGRRRG